MAQDFSDPLTSAAYASSKTTASGSDPLLAPTPTIGPLHSQASSLRKTKDSSPHSSTTLTSSPSPTPAPQQNSRLSQSASTQPKPASHAPKRTSTTATKPNRFSEEVNSFPSPSSPLSHPFTDPLYSGHSNGGDYEPYTRTASGYNTYQQNNSNINSNNLAGNRVTIASFPTTSAHTSSLPNSSRQSSAPTQQPPPVACSHSAATPPPVLHSSSPKAVSPPRKSRRDSSYDQQRVKAPQYLHITIPDTDRRGKDGMFLLSVQVIPNNTYDMLKQRPKNSYPQLSGKMC
jgi:hypothetical protein